MMAVAGGAVCLGAGGRAWADEDKISAGAGGAVLGIIADVQYGDKNTRGRRFYRESLNRLADCVRTFNARGVDFVLQLGDIIDGNATPAGTLADLDAVLGVLGRLKAPVVHVVGNHCLTAGRDTLQKRLGLKRAYYDFAHRRARGWRFVVLDGNDAGYGVLGARQLTWLAETLKRADGAGEKVIVANHFALLKAAAKHHRMKTPAPMLKILDASPCVAAYVSGHDHAGGFAVRRGVHHVTFKGMVEAPKRNAFATVALHADHLRVVGHGVEASGRLVLPGTRAAKVGAALTWPVTIGQAGAFAVELSCDAAGEYIARVAGKTLRAAAAADMSGQGAAARAALGTITLAEAGETTVTLSAAAGGDLATVRALRLLPLAR